jgi:hypothetical protein
MQRRLVLQMQMGPRMMLGGNAFSINGKTMDVNRIDEVGDTYKVFLHHETQETS